MLLYSCIASVGAMVNKHHTLSRATIDMVSLFILLERNMDLFTMSTDNENMGKNLALTRLMLI